MITNDSKKTEADSQEWGAVTLGDEELFSIGTGGTPSTSQPQFWNGNIPWVTPTDLSNLGTAVITETARTITAEGVANSSAKPLPAGSIVLSTRAPIGYASILGQEMSINQGCKGIVVKDPARVSNEYLYYNLLTQTQKMKELGSGSTFRELSQHNLKSIEIPLPEISKQNKIASILNTLHELVVKQEEIVRQNKELKSSLMKKLFTDGLKKEKLKDTEIGKLPESWQVLSVGSAVEQIQYGISKRGESTGKYAILRMNCLKDGKVESNDLQFVELSDKEYEQFRLNKGDLVFNRTNSIDLVGKVGIFELDGPFVFASYLLRIRVKPQYLLPKFLNYYLNWDESQIRLKYIATRGASQVNISASRLSGFLISIPEVAEQEKIVEILSGINDKIQLEQRKSILYKELFSAMLDRLMSGEININKIDIN